MSKYTLGVKPSSKRVEVSIEDFGKPKTTCYIAYTEEEVLFKCNTDTVLVFCTARSMAGDYSFVKEIEVSELPFKNKYVEIRLA